MNDVDPFRTLSVPVSVVILTLNEQINIGECLDSCAWCDDVHVLDSGSTDQTRAIAEERGAKTYVHSFTSFGAQRNWAIDHIPTRHDWIFHLDADERFTPELVRAMDELIRRDPPEAGFHVPSKLIFMGRWLKRAGGYPTYQMRLFHKRRMRFSDYGHGQRELTDGSVGTLDVPYLHYNFSKGLVDWFERHNRYSSLEANEAMTERGGAARLGDVLAGEVSRRRAIKRLTRRLPFRPTLRWLYTMIAQGAVLEGKAGRTYAGLLATYERMINLKLAELEHQRRASRNGAAGLRARPTQERQDAAGLRARPTQERQDAAGLEARSRHDRP